MRERWVLLSVVCVVLLGGARVTGNNDKEEDVCDDFRYALPAPVEVSESGQRVWMIVYVI